MRNPELDTEHDGVTLADLLVYDEQARGERPTNFKPHAFTPAQRAAVDAYRASENARRNDLRDRVRRVVVEMRDRNGNILAGNPQLNGVVDKIVRAVEGSTEP